MLPTVVTQVKAIGIGMGIAVITIFKLQSDAFSNQSAESGRRSSSAAQPSNPPNKPISEPDSDGLLVKNRYCRTAPEHDRFRLPSGHAQSARSLEQPHNGNWMALMTGPTTSLKMLTITPTSHCVTFIDRPTLRTIGFVSGQTTHIRTNNHNTPTTPVNTSTRFANAQNTGDPQ